MQYFTGKGDQGRTSLADGRLISKGDLAFDLLGSLDEATAHLGMAISLSQDSGIIDILGNIQGHLSKLMGAIAGVKDQAFVDGTYLAIALKWLEDQIIECGNSLEKPKGFIYSGHTAAGASVDIARTVVRRAERQAVRYFETIEDHRTDMLAYLNRLSSFLFILRLFIDNKSNPQG